MPTNSLTQDAGNFSISRTLDGQPVTIAVERQLMPIEPWGMLARYEPGLWKVIHNGRTLDAVEGMEFYYAAEGVVLFFDATYIPDNPETPEWGHFTGCLTTLGTLDHMFAMLSQIGLGV